MKGKASDKIRTLDQLMDIRRSLRERKKRLVFTNGCFDILHVGHVRYLEDASRLGDFIVVAVNSDRSMRAIKGPRRPITSEQWRAEVVAALACVDAVVIFDEETPLRLIRQLEPDVLVKGSDWSLDDIVGRKEVEASGGKVVRIDLTPGISTTAIIEKIRTDE